MKRFLLLALAGALCSVTASAQFPYHFSAYHDTYVPLDSATIVDSGRVWDLGTIFHAPIGFPFMIDTFHCSSFISPGANDPATDSNSVITSGFIIEDGDLDDRGFVTDSFSLSPVRYKVTGPVGHQIFKFEVWNAGFDQQFSATGAMTDSFCFQYWYYQDSNVVELRYGPSRVTRTDYFALGKPFAGFGQNVDTGGNGTLYILGGNPNSPNVQTVPLVAGNPTTIFSPLNSFPTSGTVYRFGPLPNHTSVNELLNSDELNVYPTSASNEVIINYKGGDQLHYNVYSITGANTNINGNAVKGLTKIDISNLPSGMYMVNAATAEVSRVFKIVKI